MDVGLQGNAQLRYGVNGGAAARNARLGDDALHFLTQEEQECLQFFESTIDSLEDGLEDDARRPAPPRTPESHARPPDDMERPPHGSSHFAMPTGPRDQDIIDLVRSGPDLVQTREPAFSPVSPDFQSMLPAPESHFEIKPRHAAADLPSEYNPPLPGGGYGAADPGAYHPPGCVPTPLMIAQKIAENQAGGPSAIDPSALLRRLSVEGDKPPGHGADAPPPKAGPPTSAKPSRYPANISVTLANKDYQTQSLANVNLQEIRAQMMANLSGTSHPLLPDAAVAAAPGAEPKARNAPSRSISFRDPTPDKSRMEALSKLGLNRGRAMSGDTSLFTNPDGSKLTLPVGGDGGVASGVAGQPEVRTPLYSLTQADRRPAVLRSDSRRSYEERSPQLSPSPTAAGAAQHGFHASHPDRSPVSPPPEVTSIEINSYGGKSIVVNPSRSDAALTPPPLESRSPPPLQPGDFNSYGGRSRAVNPAAASRSDLPDILSSHIDKSQPAPARADAHARSHKAPPPAPAPRPPRHSYHAGITQQLVAARARSPEHKRKSNSMFRPQSITVEFSGQGPMDEARRAALRKLGLLKD